jgi:hypothetical protein
MIRVVVSQPLGWTREMLGDSRHTGRVALGLGATDDLELCDIVTSNGAAKSSSLLMYMDAARYVSDISDAVETTAQVTPSWFDLSDAEQDRLHKFEDIEGHLLGRESANSICINVLSSHIMRPVPRVQLKHDSASHIQQR